MVQIIHNAASVTISCKYTTIHMYVIVDNRNYCNNYNDLTPQLLVNWTVTRKKTYITNGTGSLLRGPRAPERWSSRRVGRECLLLMSADDWGLYLQCTTNTALQL